MLIDLPVWLFFVMLACTIGFLALIPGLLWATRLKPKEQELDRIQNIALKELIDRFWPIQTLQYEKDLEKWK